MKKPNVLILLTDQQRFDTIAAAHRQVESRDVFGKIGLQVGE